MIDKHWGRIQYLSFGSLSKYKRLVDFVFTRHGGVSPKPYDSLNMSFNVGDHPKNVTQNRELVKKALGASECLFLEQVHGHEIVSVNERNITEIITDPPKADGFITKMKEIALGILTADCVPVLLYDPKKQVIGIVHAGWRGTVAKIGQKAVKTMQNIHNSDPGDIIACIAPSISPKAYSIGDEVIKAMNNAFPGNPELILQHSGNPKCDLWNANKIQLLEAGVNPKHIELANICTFNNTNLFYSHRQSGGKTGRTGAFLMLQ